MEAGMASENPRPYQKKSLISRIPASTTRSATAMERYSVTTSGIFVKKYTKPSPAARYTSITEPVQTKTRYIIRFIEPPPESTTDIIKIKTPMAQGLMESTAAVTRTVRIVGNWISTPIVYKLRNLKTKERKNVKTLNVFARNFVPKQSRCFLGLLR